MSRKSLFVLSSEISITKVAKTRLEVESIGVEDRVNKGCDDLDLRERARDRMQTLRSCQETQKHDAILRDVMIQQHTNRHQSRSTGSDHGIHQKDERVVVVVTQGRRELAVMQLRFAVGGVGLDQDLANDGITDHAPESNLHRATGSEDRDTSYAGLETETFHSLAGWRSHNTRLIREFIQSSVMERQKGEAKKAVSVSDANLVASLHSKKMNSLICVWEKVSYLSITKVARRSA